MRGWHGSMEQSRSKTVARTDVRWALPRRCFGMKKTSCSSSTQKGVSTSTSMSTVCTCGDLEDRRYRHRQRSRWGSEKGRSPESRCHEYQLSQMNRGFSPDNALDCSRTGRVQGVQNHLVKC